MFSTIPGPFHPPPLYSWAGRQFFFKTIDGRAWMVCTLFFLPFSLIPIYFNNLFFFFLVLGEEGKVPFTKDPLLSSPLPVQDVFLPSLHPCPLEPILSVALFEPEFLAWLTVCTAIDGLSVDQYNSLWVGSPTCPSRYPATAPVILLIKRCLP